VLRISEGDLSGALPDLVGGACVIALVPVEGPGVDAPAEAWTVARAAASLGRRTLLVDCFVDRPRLHSEVGATSDDGIVDAFEYGASLTRVARRQPEENLYFIPSGTFAVDAGALMANRRWQRLAAGFRHEGALLLLYLPVEALPVIAGETDGVIVLAPADFDVHRGSASAVAELADAGMPVLVVGARVPAEEGAAAPASRPSIRRSRAPFAELAAVRAGGPPRTRRAVVYAGAAVLACILGAVAIRPDWVLPTPEESEPPSGSAPVSHPVDSLPWVVQVSAWDDLPRALEAVDTLVAHGTRALVSPTSLGRRVSFRVQAGPYPSRAVADSVLRALRARGLGDPAGSVSLAAPLSLLLGGAALPLEPARAEADSLRSRGVPVFLLGQPDGRFRLAAGAFDAAARAAHLDSLLSTLGRARRLGPRAGFLP